MNKVFNLLLKTLNLYIYTKILLTYMHLLIFHILNINKCMYSCRTIWCPVKFLKIGSSYLLIYEVLKITNMHTTHAMHTWMGCMHSNYL